MKKIKNSENYESIEVIMLEIFYPEIDINSIYDLPLDLLKAKGIRLICFDIDNTVVPYDVPEPSFKEISFFKNLMEKGFKVCFISNNTHHRTDLFNEKIGGYALPRASKPKAKKLLEFLDSLNIAAKETALVGDQLFTDVWCAKNAKALSILVKPVSNRDQIQTKVKRGLERMVYKRYLKWKKKHPESGNLV